jgi:Invasion associated locus B (IalB) protein
MIDWRIFITLTGVLAAAVPVRAQAPPEPTSLGAFQDWEAYTYRAKDSRVCYVYSSPKKSEAGKKVKRDPIYFMVTHWPGRKIKGQVSTIIGYPFKESSMVKLMVDDKSFDLYTSGDMAWADGVETEKAIVVAMKTGTALTITGTSWRGTETTDSYSLSGVQAAMDKIDATCK